MKQIFVDFSARWDKYIFPRKIKFFIIKFGRYLSGMTQF